MRKLLITLAILASASPITHAGWFTHDDNAEKAHLQELQQQLQQQTHANGQMEIVSIRLGNPSGA